MRLAYGLGCACAIALSSVAAFADVPDCTDPDAWPAAMAFTHLKNAGIVDNAALDFQKTKVSRLASGRLGKNLYRQVHLVRFLGTSGESVSAITVNEASNQECSMSNLDVYVVARRLGDYTSAK